MAGRRVVPAAVVAMTTAQAPQVAKRTGPVRAAAGEGVGAAMRQGTTPVALDATRAGWLPSVQHIGGGAHHGRRANDGSSSGGQVLGDVRAGGVGQPLPDVFGG